MAHSAGSIAFQTAIATGGAALAAAFIFQPFVDPRLLFLDPVAAASAADVCCHAYYGMASTLGIMVWSACAGVCLLAALVLNSLGHGLRDIAFPLSAGLLTGWLALDDALLFHEAIAPHLGIPQTAVLALYLALTGGYLAGARRGLSAGWLPMLGFALLALGASVGLDVVLHSTDSMVTALEDGAKLIGIVAWAVFHIGAMATLLTAPLVEAVDAPSRTGAARAYGRAITKSAIESPV